MPPAFADHVTFFLFESIVNEINWVVIDYILTLVNCQMATQHCYNEIATQIKQSHAQNSALKEDEATKKDV